MPCRQLFLIALTVLLPTACSQPTSQTAGSSTTPRESTAGANVGQRLADGLVPIREPIPIPQPPPRLQSTEARSVVATQVAARNTISAWLDEAALRPMSIGPMYQRIAADIQDGKPLVFVVFVGLWGDRIENGKMDPSWDTHYGNNRYVARAHKDRRANLLFEHTDWELVAELSAETYALRTNVYRQTVEPNEYWGLLGVEEPFDAYLVLRAFPVQENAALELANALRRDDGRTIRLDQVTLDLGDAQVLGYAGHNFHYDYEDFDWRGLDDVSGHTSRPTGLFTVTCRSATVPGFMDLVEHNVYVLGFTRNFVSAEGYSLLSFVDGVLQARDGEGILDLANESYVEYHKDPDWREYHPFVGHAKRMFREDDGTVRPRTPGSDD